MSGIRLDKYLVEKGLTTTRSQAESYIKLGKVKVSDKTVFKPGLKVRENAVVKLTSGIKYISRGALKLESAADTLGTDFRGKVVLDVGSSTGGFTDFALKHGAVKIIAVDVGKNQMDKSLRLDPKIELHEQTDIRSINKLSTKIDYCLIDVSFISIKTVLEHLLNIIDPDCQIIAMVKPQFEADKDTYKQKGVIKNENVRRRILRDFEQWANPRYKILAKKDSEVHGSKGNVERFYLLKAIV